MRPAARVAHVVSNNLAPMKRPYSSILPYVLILAWSAGRAAIPTDDIGQLVEAYAFFASRHGEDFTRALVGCSGWSVELCTLQQHIEAASPDLGVSMVFVNRIERSTFQSIRRIQQKGPAARAGALYIFPPMGAPGAKVVCVLSSTSRRRTWVFSVTPALTVSVIYDSFNESTWATIEPRVKVEGISSLELQPASRELVIRRSPASNGGRSYDIVRVALGAADVPN
jgi:hypothetical protein